jgi:ketosteroid isomerase-like protein
MIGAVIARRQTRSVFDAWNRRDFAKFWASWAEDCSYAFPGSISVSGQTKGKKAIEACHIKMLEHFPRMDFTVKDVFVSSIFAVGGTNNIAVEWDLAYTNREGKNFHTSGMTAIRVKGGKSISVQEYISDFETLKEAWGKE